ncbi:peptide-methionine (R)-S-oxide reductase MsrB [Aquimarina brevivitae]|uniref:peptide-methionine (R)-S-oxide reductase n=1 Tax=Aquimarina brevivitae TaxID=323412 RepID=A0A4Q7P212_9FLAO|nr:peptide-methionine (R)-S-oxide reductase MsrB [Aquimarina brevivitae]RZS93775.1 peptide-methionine (R)-S-oxide reductase [Aquimarina brevivitae]
MKNIILFSLLSLVFGCTGTAQKNDAKEKTYPISKSDKEWKEVLTKEQYYVLRQEGTERPFSSPLNKIYTSGTFYCAACNTPLYEGEHKFDSGTGWPSFDRAIDGNVDKDIDHKLGYARTEAVCATCGGHLGHIFNDGPRETTGMRHCINGDALVFKPKEK